MALIHVDCEGVDVLRHTLRCFGAVEHHSVSVGTPITFYGEDASKDTFARFRSWLGQWTDKGERVVFVSDNVAYDWQMINYLLLLHTNANPFGHSGRRIGDFAAGLVGDFFARQEWKKLRVTPHDHNPVHDAIGNAEALHRLMNLSALDKLRKGSQLWRLEDGKWVFRSSGALTDSLPGGAQAFPIRYSERFETKEDKEAWEERLAAHYEGGGE